MTLGLKDAMAAAATDVACKNPCINSFEIQDGQVGNADIADGAVTEPKLGIGVITNTKIQDGAVTDAKITGHISASKLEKPANVIVVGKSGGDFTSIQTALNAINPTANNPYIVKVMPGIYSALTENITMKSYVHLQGAGADVTIIEDSSGGAYIYEIISIDNLTNVTISGFTIKGGYYGIHNISSSPTIIDNTITGNGHSGIYNVSSSPTIIRNTIVGNSSGIRNNSSSPMISANSITGNSNGITNSSSSPTISGNTITGNTGTGIANATSSFFTINGNTIVGNSAGISNNSSSPTISGNTITGNTGIGVSNGIYSAPTIIGNTITGNGASGIYMSYSSPTIIHNKITDNGGTTNTDIYVHDTATPNISFNIYDDITGSTGVGLYNVNSNGDSAPTP